MFERFPFLAHYNNELAEGGIGGVDLGEAPARWLDAVLAWESATDGHLPLRALRDAAALDPSAIALLMTIGLYDEDPRFGVVFDLLQGEMGQKRPTAGLLGAWWDAVSGSGSGRAQLRQLYGLGLIQPLNADAPRSEWSFQVPQAIWDAARGECHEEPAAGLRFRLVELAANMRSRLLGLPYGDQGLIERAGPGAEDGAMFLLGQQGQSGNRLADLPTQRPLDRIIPFQEHRQST